MPRAEQASSDLLPRGPGLGTVVPTTQQTAPEFSAPHPPAASHPGRYLVLPRKEKEGRTITTSSRGRFSRTAPDAVKSMRRGRETLGAVIWGRQAGRQCFSRFQSSPSRRPAPASSQGRDEKVGTGVGVGVCGGIHPRRTAAGPLGDTTTTNPTASQDPGAAGLHAQVFEKRRSVLGVCPLVPSRARLGGLAVQSNASPCSPPCRRGEGGC